MKHRRLATTLVMVSLTAGACAGGDAATTTTTSNNVGFDVSGLAHAGPTCPVVQNPPAAGCDDLPVSGAVLRVIDESGTEVARIRTRDDGTFVVNLAAGSYRLVPEPVEGLFGTAPPGDFTVGDAPVVGLDVAYDTGIR